ncbi:MAG: hypothetical protein R3A46_09920 [Thermomicrobiales bacterium]
MSSHQDERRNWSGAEGLAIPAGLFIGIGIGMVIGHVAAGVMIGLGCGFLAMMVVRMASG